MTPPLVSIVIATRNRSEDLDYTLARLRLQSYPNVEMIVIDDASEESVEPVVRRHWPAANFSRKEVNVGQCQCRTEGFAVARGKYILQLDDDASFTKSTDLEVAASCLESNVAIGLVTFYVFNGKHLPTKPLPPVEGCFVRSFLGAAALIRSTVLSEVCGYQQFFGNEWEEEELSLRLIKAGYAVFFLPDVVVHHQVSPQNRRTSRTWMRGLRNKLWALTMHYPLGPLLLESSWTVAIGTWDAIRLGRPVELLQALFQFGAGLPRALALRHPLSKEAFRRYLAVRFMRLRTYEEFSAPHRLHYEDVRRWFTQWRNRPRQRSLWDSDEGGWSETVRFGHEDCVREPRSE